MHRKVIALLLSLGMCFSVLPVISAAEEVPRVTAELDEDFESCDPGGYAGDHFKSDGAAAVVEEDGNKFLRLTSGGGDAYWYQQPITKSSVIEMSVRPTNCDSTQFLSFFNGSGHASHLLLFTNGYIYLKKSSNGSLTSSSGFKVGEYEANEWYHFKFVLKLSDNPNVPDSYDAYLNDGLIAENLSLPKLGYEITQIRYAGDRMKQCDIDDFRITPVTPEILKKLEEEKTAAAEKAKRDAAEKQKQLTNEFVDEENARKALNDTVREKQANITFHHYTPKEADFFVSPDGDDGAPGTEQAPFRSVKRARDAVREKKAGGMGEDIIVMLRGGRYELTEELRFSKQDSGVNGHRVIYTNYPGEEPVITSGKQITGWEQYGGEIYRAYIPEVKEGKWRFDQIFEDDVRSTKARYPNAGFLMAEGGEGKLQLKFSEGAVPKWKDISDAQLWVFPQFPWQNDVVPIESIDYDNRLIKVNGRTHNGRGQRYLKKDYYFIQGVLEELDMPGEFYLDESEGYLYYWPKGDINEVAVTAPQSENLISFHGDSWNQKVENITFEGMTLTQTKFVENYTIMDGNEGGSRLYPGEDTKRGLFYLENAKGIEIKRCHLRNSGLMGVAVNYYAQDNVIYGNEITQTGYTGVFLTGIQEKKKFEQTEELFYDCARNIVSNNYIHETGILAWHGAGVMVYHSRDNDISYNVITDNVRQAIFTMAPEGGIDSKDSTTINNTIRYNHVDRVNTETHDTGALNNWNAAYTIFDTNKVAGEGYEDSFLFGIYLDNCSTRVNLKNNIVYGVTGDMPHAVFFRGHEDSVHNNVFVSEGGPNSVVLFNHPQDQAWNANIGHRVERNILYAKADNENFIKLHGLNDESFTFFDYNTIFAEDGNYKVSGINGGDDLDRWREIQDGKFDQHSLVADPGFENINNNQYRLKPDAAAFKTGFNEIREYRIGTLPSYPFAVEQPLEKLYLHIGDKMVTADIPVGGVAKAETVGRTHDNFAVPLDNGTLKYESSNPAVAEVDTDGTIRVKNKGTAEISVSYQADGKTFSTGMLVNVGDFIKNLTFTAEADTITPGQRIDLQAVLETEGGYFSGTDRIALTCDHPDALVFDDGSFMARKTGDYTIKALAKYCGDTEEKSLVIHVVDQIITDMKVVGVDQLQPVGETGEFKASVYYSDGSVETLSVSDEKMKMTFTSSNESVFKVDGTNFTALTPGEAEVSYTLECGNQKVERTSKFIVFDAFADGWKVNNISKDLALSDLPLGNVTEENGIYTFDTATKDVYGQTDEFTYLYQEIKPADYPNGFTLSMTIDTLDGGSGASMCGLMIRDALTDDAKMVHMRSHKDGKLPFVQRLGDGASAANVSGNPIITLPNRMKLTMRGNTITGYVMENGSWRMIRTIDIPMEDTIYVGAAAAQYAKTTISGLSLTPGI